MSASQLEKAPHSNRAVLTVQELCEILDLRKSSAYLAISRGQIPSIRIGGQIRIPRAAVEKMLDPGAI